MEAKMGSDRSESFREWLKDMNDEKIDKLVRMEKQVRILIHVWNLVNEFDMKAFHLLARVAHQIRNEYEGK